MKESRDREGLLSKGREGSGNRAAFWEVCHVIGQATSVRTRELPQGKLKIATFGSRMYRTWGPPE